MWVAVVGDSRVSVSENHTYGFRGPIITSCAVEFLFRSNDIVAKTISGIYREAAGLVGA